MGKKREFTYTVLHGNFQKPGSEPGLWLPLSTIGMTSSDGAPMIPKHLSGPSCSSLQGICLLNISFPGFSPSCSTTELFLARIGGAEILGPAMGWQAMGGLGKPPLPAAGAPRLLPPQELPGERRA